MSKKANPPAGAKRVSEIHGKEFLQEAFYHEQLALLQKLELAEKSITHQGKRGDVTEKHFIISLRAYFPSRGERTGTCTKPLFRGLQNGWCSMSFGF